MDSNELQSRLDTFTDAVEKSREAYGAIGGSNSNTSNIPDTVTLRKEFMDGVTAAAVTNSIRLSNGNESVVLDKVLRIEHQTWIRGKGESGTECVNLLEYNDIDLV